MNFLEILEEATSFNTKDLSTKKGKMSIFANILAVRIRKHIGSSNPRHILRNLWGAAQAVITPEVLNSYKSFLSDQDDVLTFLNMVQTALKIPEGYKSNFLRMIIDKFPVSDYSYTVGSKGEPSLTRGKVTQFKQHPVTESTTPKEELNHYIKYIFFRIRERVPNLRNAFAMAQVILEYLGKELHQFSPRQLEYFVKGIERYIHHHNQHYKGGILKYLNARQNPEDVYSNVNEPESARLRIEGTNPYLTQSQKYTQDHPNQDGHQHSMRRTTGNDIDRQRKTMVPSVRKDLKNPYIADVANKAQTKSKILTPIEIQQISDGYNIDFDDRRVKTIKGKTNMILTPLKNGGWKLEHR